jgi:hypothetical protein
MPPNTTPALAPDEATAEGAADRPQRCRFGTSTSCGGPCGVERQVQRVTGGDVDVRAPKYGSERTVFIPDELVRMLSIHMKAKALSGDAWLFTVDGKPAHQNTVGHQWRRACKAADVDGSRCTHCGTSTRRG